MIRLEILSWSYSRHYNIKARFDAFPNSEVIFRKIKDYYFIYTIFWSETDAVVERSDLELMEIEMNRELGTIEHYFMRRKFVHKE